MKREQAREIADQYCCLDLLAAEGEGVISTASGGVWLGRGSDTGCMSDSPRAQFCPFCGARIVAEAPIADRSGWSWHTEARRDA